MMKPLSRRNAEHLFFSGMALLLIGYVLFGFWPTYIRAGFVLAPLPSLLVHVHALLFVGWIALFAVQIGLVGTGRVMTHRRLGTVMGWWAAAMVVAGPATVIMAMRRPGSGIDASIMAGDFGQTIAFITLIATGLVRRRNAAEHKRLMTLATAAIMGPALARWPFVFMRPDHPIGITLFYLLPPVLLVAYDVAVLRRVHRATWLGLGLMVLVLAAFVALPAWSGWLAFAHWVQQA